MAGSRQHHIVVVFDWASWPCCHWQSLANWQGSAVAGSVPAVAVFHSVPLHLWCKADQHQPVSVAASYNRNWQFYIEILRYLGHQLLNNNKYLGHQLLNNNIERPVLKTEHFDSDWVSVFLESSYLQQICIFLSIFQKSETDWQLLYTANK